MNMLVDSISQISNLRYNEIVIMPPLITEIKPKFKQKDFMNSPKIIGRILLICYCWIILRYTKRL